MLDHPAQAERESPVASDSYIDALEIHPSLLALLGRVVAHWSYVETLESDFLAYLVDGNPIALRGITRHCSAGAVTDWVRILATHRFTGDAMAGRMRDLFERIERTRAERNAYVQGLWRAGPEPVTALVRTVRRDRQELIGDELVAPDDLKNLLKVIAEIHDDLAAFGRQLGFHPTPET